MDALRPTRIERLDQMTLRIEWGDGFSAAIPLELLRHSCPCAYCQGEQVFGTTVMLPLQQYAAGMNELVALEPVGNYGVRARWADGHNTGIYTWQLLRELAQKVEQEKTTHSPDTEDEA
ncbi:MAG: DUF971 domain-containing protein [Bacteroidota bacterium]|nr:DUF971 domain-containing protein [Candidatus Kapabacteria bacterium]MCX7937298.1 DUF971 domain-containing protein [Chlorobiota bacterium]MDW8075560.1 DUF971 domain-containing protein [Bacteroidota bacterium]MDW8271761.1 DUF971 domain-containing protein [Bacteroidota bacterium]